MAESKLASTQHCVYCFDMLIEELTGVQSDFDWTSLPLAHSKMPVFVTWHKHSPKRKHDELRGCLGTFSQEIPIAQGLKKYSVMSAVNDKRFSPITAEELSALKVQISLLHSFTRCQTWDDWDIGTHGITIQFQCPSTAKSYNATYLPEVARQQRWDKVTTIDHLVAKAGYNGTAQSVSKLVVTKYQSCKECMSWHEFLLFAQTDRVLISRVKTLYTVTSAKVYDSMTKVNGLENDVFTIGIDDDRKKGKKRSTGCYGNHHKHKVSSSSPSTSSMTSITIKSTASKLLRYASSSLRSHKTRKSDRTIDRTEQLSPTPVTEIANKLHDASLWNSKDSNTSTGSRPSKSTKNSKHRTISFTPYDSFPVSTYKDSDPESEQVSSSSMQYLISNSPNPYPSTASTSSNNSSSSSGSNTTSSTFLSVSRPISALSTPSHSTSSNLSSAAVTDQCDVDLSNRSVLTIPDDEAQISSNSDYALLQEKPSKKRRLHRSSKESESDNSEPDSDCASDCESDRVTNPVKRGYNDLNRSSDDCDEDEDIGLYTAMESADEQLKGGTDEMSMSEVEDGRGYRLFEDEDNATSSGL